MLEIFRTHGLIVFMLALGMVCLAQGNLAIAALMAAVVIEELQRRGMAPAIRVLDAARWCFLLGAVGLMLRAA